MANRTDDGTVGDDEVLWRRIYPDWIERDGAGRVRARSMAFLDRKSGEISVHRSHLTTEAFVLRQHPNHGIVALQAKVPRTNGYAVADDPIENEPGVDNDPSHALMIPPADAGSKRIKSLAKQLALAATIVREPTPTMKQTNEDEEPNNR